jgi:predicted MPP superfamily phosphohydrolase
MKVAAVGDLHCKKTSRGAFEPLFAAMRAAADVLVLCGDLTDYGLPDEARVLVKELGAAKGVPVVGVLGNHDYESGEADQVKAIFGEAGVRPSPGSRAHSAWPFSTTRRFRPRCRASRRRSFRTWDRAASRNRC